MKALPFLMTCFLMGASMATLFANPPRERMWEYLINERVMEYPLRSENLFRLAVYAELKGHYFPNQDALSLEFGSLANLHFFAGHCLLKTSDGRMYSIPRGNQPTVQSESLDASLDQLFDRMPLLNDASANPLVVAHVDDHLSRKNLEPFDKLFLRHLLVHYGRYNPEIQAVEFHTDWLKEFPGSGISINDTDIPLKIRLDRHTLRGYYINSGGTVFVENVPRSVAYATGEEYGSNVTAFKVFMEKVLIRSVQYVVQEDTRRGPITPPALERPSTPLPVGYQKQAQSHQSTIGGSTSTPAVEALYAPEKWMNFMLAVLRARNINIGDSDVIRYFVNQEYFDRLYQLMLPEEQARAKAFLERAR